MYFGFYAQYSWRMLKLRNLSQDPPRQTRLKQFQISLSNLISMLFADYHHLLVPQYHLDLSLGWWYNDYHYLAWWWHIYHTHYFLLPLPWWWSSNYHCLLWERIILVLSTFKEEQQTEVSGLSCRCDVGIAHTSTNSQDQLSRVILWVQQFCYFLITDNCDR